MEPNMSKTDKTEDSSTSGDDDGADEPPSTSKADDINPQHKSHNMNDLTPLDLNSADEIRQAMKRVLGGKSPQNYQNYSESENARTTVDKHPILKSPDHSTEQQVRIADYFVESKAFKPVPASSRKRPGTPSKAGPSRKRRRPNVKDMYLGKLSNVMLFHKRREPHKYDSDTECDYTYNNRKKIWRKKFTK